MFEPLGKLIRLEYGQALPSEQRTGYGYPVFGSNGVVGYHEHPLITGPGIVIGRKGSVGKAAWSEVGFWPIDTTYYVESQGCDISWAYRVLDWLPLQDLDTSTGVPGLNRNDVYEISVFVPGNKEQAVIARTLDTLDTQIQNTEALIAKLEKVKEGLLHDLLTRGIDENGQLRPSPEQAPELYKESPLGLIPREWSVSTLGERLSQYGGFIQTGPFGSQLHAEEYVREGVPVVMPQDMRDIEVSKENIAQITEERAEDLARHRVGEGDLLFSRRGDLRRCSFMSSSNKGWLCGTGCLLLRPAEHIDGFWLANIYKLSAIQSQVYGMAVGSTMVNLNSTILKNIVIPFPAFQEQSKIAEAIKSSKNKIFEEINILSKLKLQKIGLIDDLLTGRVRVTPLLDQAQATTPA